MLAVINFLNPNVLWGLLAVAIPIIIHLFNLRRVKRVEFSNTSLLKRVKEESSAKRKPVELLILISRILGVIFLVLTFARPVYKNKENDLSLQDEVLIYLDNSLSLSVKDNGQQTAFDNAYSLTQDLVNAYPDGTVFRFIENAYANSIATEFTRSTLTDNLTEIQQVGVDRSFQEIANRQTGQGIKGDVYFVSDFQDNTGLSSLQSDTTSNYFLVPVSGSEYSNVYIDSVYLQNTFLSGSVTNLLRIRLRRNDRSTDRVNVKLYLDDRLSGTSQVSFEDNLLANYDFEIPAIDQGMDRIRISIDDPGLAFDNDYYLAINQLDKIRVLEVYQSGTPSYVSSLFEDNELFQFERVNANSLDNQKIEAADFILINQLSSYTNQLTNAISNSIDDGKTVLVVPSRQSTSSELNRLGLRVTGDTRQRVDLEVPDYENPFFEGVFVENSQNLEMPNARVYFRLINEELPYLSFKNGRSFLSKVLSNGSLFFFSSSFDESITSFPNHALFVPVLYKLALGSKANLSNLYYSTDDETIVYPINGQDRSNIYELRRGEVLLIPDQRQEENRLIMEIPKDQILAGHYELVLNNQVVGTLAFNIPKEESNVHTIDFDYLEELSASPSITLLNGDGGQSVREEIRSGIDGIPLWKYALLGALLFLFLEIILIRYL
ncbi:BatA domain-containing protein [Roseivirga sp. E12]|uniref:BatA domain-containing protein n=1 Tax=Roseivirga sp. E12 TaxID=2819237 RepID=UPI001ABCE4EE|nr:BatA domain-containing protein [Roseivirga sp. E12]MBO3700235.1 BatA domain-containing protein [Roseivirga sp. E12]